MCTTNPRKKASLGESLAESHAYNPIRDSGETLDEREKFRQESRLDSWWASRQESWRDFSRSPSASRESRIGLYAWLSARLSETRFFYAGTLPTYKKHMLSWAPGYPVVLTRVKKVRNQSLITLPPSLDYSKSQYDCNAFWGHFLLFHFFPEGP